MIEITKKFNVPYEPDPEVMKPEDPTVEAEEVQVTMSQGVPLIDFGFSGAVGGQPIVGGQPVVPAGNTIGFNVLNSATFMPPSSPLPPPIPVQPPVTEKSAYFDHTNIPPPNNTPNPTSFLDTTPPPNYDSIINTPSAPHASCANSADQFKPTPIPRTTVSPPEDLGLPELPEVPEESPNHSNNGGGSSEKKEEDIDFDDLAKRFEALKKRK